VTVVETPTYSTAEVSRITGCSYRQLDYWIRTGIIEIRYGAHGSGSRRRWTEAEVERLERVVERYREAVQVMHEFQSGELWRRAA